MNEQDKLLLLKDLCARLPYGVKLMYVEDLVVKKESHTITLNNIYLEHIINGDADIKPYLRPMSSMTEEEKRELQSFYPGCFGSQWLDTEKGTIDIFECSSTITLYLNDSERIVDRLNKKMFDYRGLIPMGLALEAPEGMYEI